MENGINGTLADYENSYANKMKDYWESCGPILFGNNDILVEKWRTFVETQVSHSFVRGALMDQTIQIIQMINSNIPIELIAQTINKIPGGKTIVDSYLWAFIHPEIVDGLQNAVQSLAEEPKSM